jgi:hypothetical protein
MWEKMKKKYCSNFEKDTSKYLPNVASTFFNDLGNIFEKQYKTFENEKKKRIK